MYNVYCNDVKLGEANTNSYSLVNPKFGDVYKVEALLKLTAGHESRTLYDDNGTNPTYYFKINNVVYNPEDKTSTRQSLGINTNNYTPVTYISALTLGTGTKTIDFCFQNGGQGYSMRVSSVRFTPLAGVVTVESESTTDNGYSTQTNIARGGQSGYIPLSVDGSKKDFLSNSNPSIDKYKTAKSNTGYIVGGYYDKRNGGDGQSAEYTGDVRIAAYDISSISNSYNTSTKDFTNIQTYNSTDGKHTIPKSEYTTGGTGTKTYKKLASSLSNLKTTLNGSSYVYGIHFMDATISKDHIITAPKATVNGTDYVNYELPEDCVDFSLKAKGYITKK